MSLPDRSRVRGARLLIGGALALFAIQILAGRTGCFPFYRYRGCGHRETVLDNLGPFRTTHCCHTAAGLVNDLQAIFIIQETFRDVKGRHAASLAELEGLFPECGRTFRNLAPWGAVLRAEADRWEIFVPRAPGLPGSYLHTSDGALHFSEQGPATASSRRLR